MNVLIIGNPSQNLLEAIYASRRLDKLYTAIETPLEDIPNIEFNTFEELVYKSKALKIDIAITSEKKLIELGIADILKKSRINTIAVNQKWFNLESSRLVAKQLVNYYSINVPEIIKAPLAFPVVLKTDTPEVCYIAHTMRDLVSKIESLGNVKIFLEDYINAEVYSFVSLWDGKNLLSFPLENLTEVQTDRLELLKTKLTFMLSDEHANFIGFFTTKLIWTKNDWYFLEFKMRFEPEFRFPKQNPDLLYLLDLAIYQKLNEV